ncbi:hypothetical protein ACHAXT_001651 [Thalassiosira profunda]
MRGAAAAAGPARPTEVRPPAIATVISDVTTPHFGKLASVPEGRPAALKKKRVNITVTVLSVAGLFVKDGAPKKKGIIKKFPSGSRSLSRSSRRSKAEESRDGDSSTQTASTSKDTAESKSPSEGPPTTIVASFSRAVPTREGKSRTVLAHVPSLPLPLLAADNGSSGGNTLDSVVHWPEPRNTSHGNNTGKILSSYQFQHTFQQEERTAGANAFGGIDNEPSQRYAPQPLDIQVAISRSGRLFKLGTARLFLSGEENGERSRNVPIMNCNPPVPKSGKHSKWLNSGGKETVIPMMKLKGDTLKCGLDPNATLRVLVRASEPIGETVEVSPNVTVTMISHSDRRKQQKKEEELRRQRESYRRQDALAGDMPSANGEEAAYPQEICWEYNPALAAVVAKDPKKEGRDDGSNESEGPLVRVLSLQDEDTRDGEEDAAHEASCTSSAYMSALDNGRRHNHSVPTKGRSELTGVRSANTRTTATGSTLISDLTDGRSWLSQTGIEVIPFAPAATAPNAGRRPARSGSKLKANESIAVDSLTAGASLLDKEVEEHEATAQFPRATAKKPGWRQRLACGMPLCGAAGVNAGDHLLAVHEEEDVVVTNKRWGLIGRCANGNLSEDDGSSVDDNSSDEESNCADDY